jgi:hypothetical protein
MMTKELRGESYMAAGGKMFDILSSQLLDAIRRNEGTLHLLEIWLRLELKS